MDEFLKMRSVVAERKLTTLKTQSGKLPSLMNCLSWFNYGAAVIKERP
jgi:hypothetical protein